MMNSSSHLGFIGLGVMGEPICRNITQSHDGTMIVFDLKSEPMMRLQNHGAQAAGKIADVAEQADTIFLSLPGGTEVENTVLGEDGLFAHGREGQIIVDMSTCPVGTARHVAARLAEKNMHFADAPVARTRKAAEEGDLSIMVGCSEQIFDRIRPSLEAAASDITHCGDVGAGQVVKLMNNMVLFQTVVGLAEALTIGERAGVSPEILADTLSKGSADSFALRNHGFKSMVPEIYPVDAFATDYAIKDISYALELASDYGVGAPAGELVKSILKRTSEAGYGKEYFPVLKNLVKKHN